MRALPALVLAVIIALSPAAAAGPVAPGLDQASHISVNAGQALRILNEYRRARGLAPVRLDPSLMAAARSHARDMAGHDRLAHAVSRGDLAVRVAGTGRRPRLAAENVSAGYRSVERAFGGWKNSPAHNRNMLLADIRRMGIAAAYTPTGRYKVYWTLIVASGD